MSFAADYAKGTQSEGQHQGTLEAWVGEPLVSTATRYNRFHPVDFEGQGCWVEVKTLGCCSATHEALMMPWRKIAFAADAKKPVYFVWALQDGLFFIRYDPDVFINFPVRMYQPPPRADRVDPAQPYCYIPARLVTRLPCLGLNLVREAGQWQPGSVLCCGPAV
jgi:hypothetical protein